MPNPTPEAIRDEQYVEARCQRRRMTEHEARLSLWEKRMTRAGLLDAFKLAVPAYVAWLAGARAHMQDLDAQIAAREQKRPQA